MSLSPPSLGWNLIPQAWPVQPCRNPVGCAGCGFDRSHCSTSSAAASVLDTSALSHSLHWEQSRQRYLCPVFTKSVPCSTVLQPCPCFSCVYWQWLSRGIDPACLSAPGPRCMLRPSLPWTCSTTGTATVVPCSTSSGGTCCVPSALVSTLL